MTVHWRKGVLVAIFMGTALTALGQTLPPEVVRYADLVLHNGKVLTADETFSIQQAVAIREGQFLAVGTTERILSMAGPQTLAIDLAGATVVPGFIATDADNEFAGGNLYKATQIRGELLGTLRVYKREDIWARMQQLLKDVPAGEPVFLRFDNDAAPTELTSFTKEDLDRLAPRNPLMATAGGVETVVNSLMMEKILELLPKEHPHILKDEQTGQPNGRIYGFALGVVGWDLRPWPRIDDSYLNEQKQNIQEVLGKGVTTLVGHIQGFTVSVLNLLAHQGELNIRVRGSHDFLRQNPNSEAFLRRIGNLVDFGLGDLVKIIGAGLESLDGAADHGSALTLRPKVSSGGFAYGPYGKNDWVGDRRSWDDPTVDRSKTEWASVMAAIKYGWNFSSIHNVGDGATAIWLEAVEKGLSQPDLVMKPQFRPFGLDHNHFWNASQDDKVKEFDVRRGLGKVFSSPGMALEMYGESIHDAQPVPELIEKGFKVHIEGAEPLEEIQRYVTRKDEKGHIWGPDHAVDRKTALLMKTLWAARFIGEDHLLGSIQPGKLADLVVLGEDYLSVPDSRLAQIPVVMTVVDGRIVHRKGM